MPFISWFPNCSANTFPRSFNVYELQRSKSKAWLHFLLHISNTIHDSSIWCYEGRRIETSTGFKICSEGRHKFSILFRKKISFTSRSNTASHSFCFSQETTFMQRGSLLWTNLVSGGLLPLHCTVDEILTHGKLPHSTPNEILSKLIKPTHALQTY